MARITLSFVFIMGLIVCEAQDLEETLTKKDRKVLINHLNDSKSDLFKKVKALSTEQWNYKPTPETWSIAEICEHIYKAESVVLNRVGKLEGKAYKPGLIPQYLVKADSLYEFIVGREKKFQAPERISPEGLFASPQDFIEQFKTVRQETVQFVETLELPIKAYYEVFGPIGEVNGYHWLLFISAHTERHMIQMDEVLQLTDFPG